MPPGSPTIAMYLGESTVVMCMRAGLYQTKNGLPVFFGHCSRDSPRPWKRSPRPRSSNTPGERTLILAGLISFRTIGGVAPDHRPGRRQAEPFSDPPRGDLSEALDRGILARRSNGLVHQSPVIVGEAHSLHRIQVVQVAPEFLEAVRCRQRLRVIAQVVLAELAGVIAEVDAETSRAPGCRAAGTIGCREAAAGSCRCAIDACR